MPATKALFTGAGSTNREVQKCFYQITRPTDHKGRPSSVTQGGKITIELMSNDGDAQLASWIMNPKQEEDGLVTFIDNDGDTLKEVKFTKGRCVSYSEDFTAAPNEDDRSRTSMILKLLISAETITISGSTLDNKWADK